MDRIAYRPEEVAKLTGLGRTTVFELIRTGELESTKAGRARLVSAEALGRFVNGQRTDVASEAAEVGPDAA